MEAHSSFFLKLVISSQYKLTQKKKNDVGDFVVLGELVVYQSFSGSIPGVVHGFLLKWLRNSVRCEIEALNGDNSVCELQKDDVA